MALGLVVAGGPATRATEPAGLVLGTVLPDTGVLDSYGPATQRAVRLAVEDARAAGADVTLVPGDSGDGVGRLEATVERLRSRGVSVVIGPMSSRLMLDTLGAFNGLAIVSPATSSPLLTGRLARISPSDALQGAALAKVAAQSDVVRLAIVVPRGNSAFVDAAVGEATARGVDTRVITYSPSTSASKISSAVVRAAADGLLLASGMETTGIVRELLRRGLPATVLLTATAGAGVDPKQLRRQALAGARVLGPDVRVPEALRERLGNQRRVDYAAHAYDAAAVAILAAEVVIADGGEATGPAVAAVIPGVTTVGQSCDLAECLRLVRLDRDIDYRGLSGEVDLGPDGDPVVAVFELRTLGANNTPGTRVSYVRVP